jgi:alkylation response protein AidB-like acyl-CoA dehydrogenase
MGVILNGEREELLAAIRAFGVRSVLPQVAEYDRNELIPLPLLREMADIDLFGGIVPERWSGTEFDFETFSILIEEVSRFDHNLGVLMSMPSALVGAGILHYGTDKQREQFLAPLARGEIFGGAGVTEPQSGSDVAGTRTKFRRADSGYILNGHKTWISNLEIASFFVIFARQDGESGPGSMSAFLVPADSRGVSRTPFRNKLGFRPMSTGDLFLDDVFVPEDALLGPLGSGYRVAMIAVGTGRIAVASRAVGVAQTCLDDSVQWAQERETFGRPIASYQQVGRKLADMAIEVEAARQLVRRSARAMDNHDPDARALVSMAKTFATDVAHRAATEAVQILGSNGIGGDVRVGRLYRDAKVFQIIEGTNEIQRNLISRSLTGVDPR